LINYNSGHNIQFRHKQRASLVYTHRLPLEKMWVWLKLQLL